MNAEQYLAYAVTRAKQLRIDANEAARVGRRDIATMLRSSASVYIGNARFAKMKVTA